MLLGCLCNYPCAHEPSPCDRACRRCSSYGSGALLERFRLAQRISPTLRRIPCQKADEVGCWVDESSITWRLRRQPFLRPIDPRESGLGGKVG
jgi:hypothetical protein